MEIQNLPLEMEREIYTYAFGIDVDFLVKHCLRDKYYLSLFINEHSTFIINQIDWFDFFMCMIHEIDELQINKQINRRDYYRIKQNIDNNLEDFLRKALGKTIKVDIDRLRGFHKTTRMFGGDDFYEYILDKLPNTNYLLSTL